MTLIDVYLLTVVSAFTSLLLCVQMDRKNYPNEDNNPGFDEIFVCLIPIVNIWCTVIGIYALCLEGRKVTNDH